MNKEQNNMNSLEAEPEEIIGDMDYISEYTDGTESREAAEEVRKQIKDLITFHEQQARKGLVEEMLSKVTGQNNGDVVPLMWAEYWLLDNYGELVPDFYQDKEELKKWILDLISDSKQQARRDERRRIKSYLNKQGLNPDLEEK